LRAAGVSEEKIAEWLRSRDSGCGECEECRRSKVGLWTRGEEAAFADLRQIREEGGRSDLLADAGEAPSGLLQLSSRGTTLYLRGRGAAGGLPVKVRLRTPSAGTRRAGETDHTWFGDEIAPGEPLVVRLGTCLREDDNPDDSPFSEDDSLTIGGPRVIQGRIAAGPKGEQNNSIGEFDVRGWDLNWVKRGVFVEAITADGKKFERFLVKADARGKRLRARRVR